jgi:hypothetical protein
MNDKDIRFAISAEDRFSRVFQTLKRDIANVGSETSRLQDVASVASRAVGTLTLGTVAGVGGLGLVIKTLADDLDALNDASDAVGDTVENLSALEDVARRNGETLDLVVTAASKLNKTLGEGDENSRVGQALKAIGLSAKELRDVNPTEALQRIAVALQGYENDGNRARIVTELFGKSSRQVSAFLNDLASAGQLNAKVTREQAAEAERFNKELFALQATGTELARTFGGPLISGFNEFVGAVKGLGPGTLSEFVAVPLQTAAVVGANVGFVIKGIATEIGGLVAQSQAITRLDFAGARRIGEEMRADAKAAREEFDKLERKLLQLGSVEQASYSNEGRFRAIAARRAPSLADDGSRDSARRAQPERSSVLLSAESQSLNDALRRLEQTDIAKLDRLQSELTALFDLQRETRGSPAVSRAIQQLNEDLDALNARNLPTTAIDDPREQQRTDFLRSEREAYGQIEESIKAMAAGGSKELDKFGVTIDRFAESSVEALLSLGDGAEFSAKRLFDAFRRDLLREFIEQPVKDSMKNVVKLIKDELGKLDGANNPIAALLKLLDGLGGGGASLGSSLEGLGGFTGGFTSRAMGGGVRAGELVRWMENGREWFVPGQNGTVLTQAQLQGAGGGSYVNNYNFQISGADPRQTARQVRAMLDEREARSERSRRYGKLRQT